VQLDDEQPEPVEKRRPASQVLAQAFFHPMIGEAPSAVGECACGGAGSAGAGVGGVLPDPVVIEKGTDVEEVRRAASL
jgi:hypothetical protein